MSEFYEKYKETNNISYLHLSYLNGYTLALKHLEYLDKENALNYLLMYHRKNNFKEELEDIINIFYPYKSLLSCWEEIWFSNNNFEVNNLEEYYEKMKKYLPITINEHLAMILLYDLYCRKTGKENDLYHIAEKYAIKLLNLYEYIPLYVKIIVIVCLSNSKNKEIHLRLKSLDLRVFNEDIRDKLEKLIF
jgi:hypothetical protein